MVTPEGQVKLMDFGIAKAVGDRRLTATGSTLGSLFYMSPEQVKGVATLDGRTDLYSVGVSLYEMVTGTRPFKGESDYSLMVAHLDQQPVPPIQLDPTLPPGLNEVILTAIQKDPENRFQTALAFRTALESIKQSLAPPVGKPVVAAAAVVPPAAVPTQTARVVLPLPVPPVQATPAPPSYATPAPPPYATPVPPPYATPAPPPYAAPMPPPYATPVPPPYAAPAPPPQAQAGSSHRGLWMALGGALVVALLVVAAIYLPGWYRAHAGQPAPVVVDQQKPAESAQPPSEPAAQAPSEPATPAPTQAPAAAVAPVPAAPSSRPSAAVKGRGASAARAGQPVQATESAPPPPPPAPEPPPAAPAVEPTPGLSPVDQVALDHAVERLGMLSARANAVRGTLQHLEEQQRKEGYGLRGDISASWKRLEYLLDQTEGALKRQDLAAARRNLNLAERETDKLEKFLGR
jgi:serine/threonine-protein kinase